MAEAIELAVQKRETRGSHEARRLRRKGQVPAVIYGHKEETLTEYICDWPDCPNVAEHVIGAIRELRAFSAVCKTHAAVIAAQRQR